MTDVRGLVRTTRSAATFCLGVSLIANVFFASSMLDDLNLMLMVGVIALELCSVDRVVESHRDSAFRFEHSFVAAFASAA